MSRDSLQSRWRRLLEIEPGAKALGFYSRHGDFGWQSRSELHAAASTYRRVLEESGLGRGEICLIVLPSGELAATVLLGALLAGAVPLLVAPPSLQGANSHLGETIRSTVRRSRARVVVFQEGHALAESELDTLGAGAVLVLGAEMLPPAPSSPSWILPDPKDIAAMQLTSGTTGRPRICVWQQKGVLAALDGMTNAMGLTTADTCFNWTPLYHDMGLVNNFLLCVTGGVPLAMLDPLDFVRDPALWLRGLSETGATVTWSPNFGYAVAAERIRDETIKDVTLDRVRAFWNAAERIHLSTMLTFQERFTSHGVASSAMKTNFGCAENVGGATFSDPDGDFIVDWVDRDKLYDDRIAISVGHDDPAAVPIVGVGRPYPGLTVEVISPTGDLLIDGEVGEIVLRTPSRMSGYLQDAVATRHALLGEGVRTGDVGYQRGEELFWVGRVQERITIRGRKIDPSDFEPVLFGIEGLRPGCFVAFGVDDPQRGTQGAVVISEIREPSTRDRDEIVGDVRRAAFDTLGISLDEVLLVPPGTLTKTSSGKRRHRHFQTLYLEGQLASVSGPTSSVGAE